MFQAVETKSRDFEDNPDARRSVSGAAFGVFLAALVATRRRTAGGALCLPPCLRVLVAPLPQKSHTASRVAIFGDPIIGAHLLFMGANSPSSRKPQVYGYLGALSEKRRFRTRFLLIIFARYKATGAACRDFYESSCSAESCASLSAMARLSSMPPMSPIMKESSEYSVSPMRWSVTRFCGKL